MARSRPTGIRAFCNWAQSSISKVAARLCILTPQKVRDSYTIREASEMQLSWPSGALTWILSLLMVPVLLVGQNLSPAESTNTVTGRKLFTQLCSGCHGADGYGTQQGPALVGNRRVRARSLQALRDLIHNGIPVAGMPAFALSNNELSELASLVHSLNAPAAESAMAGDPAPGERFFFGEGRCASCHMVKGRGKPVGPDLSNVGRERSVDEIRTALLQPSARITAGYEIVTVKLRSGKTIRGFARSRSNFDIVLQDFDGNFHMLHDGDGASITAEKQSLMPAVDAGSKEFHNLMIYLSRLSGVKPGIPLTAESKESGGIDFSRIVKPEPGDWLSYNGKLSAN